MTSNLEQAAETIANENQPSAVDLFGNLEPVAFPIQVMPEPTQAFIADQADLMGVDPGMIALTALGVVAGCLDDRIVIQPKRHDPTWTESARLWVVGVGQPSAKKTPAIKKAIAPAYSVDKAMRERTNQQMAEWLEQCENAKKDDETPPEKPLGERLIYSDTTVEKLASILSENTPRGCIVFRDELDGWISSMDAYRQGSGGKDRAAWLEAFNGGSMSVDRVMRGSTYVENWSACVIGGIQPSIIQRYNDTASHDGMLQRFILLYVTEAQRGCDRKPDLAAKDRYHRLVEHIASVDPDGRAVQLSEPAHEIREKLWNYFHDLVTTLPNQYLTAALGKWEGISARLMLVFHAIECAQQSIHPVDAEVQANTAQAVSDLMVNCLLPNAVRFYNGMDTTEDHAQKVARLILAKGMARIRPDTDLQRDMRESRRWKPWELDSAINRLVAFGWIVPDEHSALNERGRPKAYDVNPDVHRRFEAVTAKERDRREKVARHIGQLGQG